MTFPKKSWRDIEHLLCTKLEFYNWHWYILLNGYCYGPFHESPLLKNKWGYDIKKLDFGRLHPQWKMFGVWKLGESTIEFVVTRNYIEKRSAMTQDHIQKSNNLTHLHSRRYEYLLHVWAMRHWDVHHKTSTCHQRGSYCDTQHNLELAMLCLKLSVGERRLRDNYLVCPQEVWYCGGKAE